MNRTICKKHAMRLALGLAVLALAAAPSFAQTYDLCATDGFVTMPDSTVVPIWGFVETASCTTGLATSLPGPVLRPAPGSTTVTVNLTNALNEPVSFFVPGLPVAAAGGAAGFFTMDAAAIGGTASYTVDLTGRSGTYLYHSATSNLPTHMAMGLYGALVVDVATGQAYADVSYDDDEVLVLSEIDPNLNANPAGFNMQDWTPRYFLINGQPYDAATPDPPIAINVSDDVMLRFVNAGLQTFDPTFDGGLYMSLIAEDGNRYPHPILQYGLELPAAKTIDAMVNVGAEGTYPLYDRALHLTNGGLVTYFEAGAVAGAPVANADAYSVAEDDLAGLVVAAPGVLGNDDPGTGGTMTASLVSDASSGTLALAADGSFSYAPNADFSGIDTFTYVANDGGPDSNVATVTITVTPVNDGPVAVADAYDVPTGAMLTVAAPGVLANDIDVDGDALTVTGTTAPSAGILTMMPNGSFTFDAAGVAAGAVTFDYDACDAEPLCSTATVTITVLANVAPTAIDDTSQVAGYQGNQTPTSVTFSVVANDEDPNGNINPASVIITTGATTQRGGTVINNGDGTVTFSPKKGFRGTDLFQYTVADLDGAVSNVATARVNVQ